MSPPCPVLIFHVTHLTNLPQIVASGGLSAYSALRRSGISYSSVADTGIQNRRSKCVVPCGPGGVVHDYVPFYFAPRSPMLYRLANDTVLCPGGQDAVVCLVSEAESVYAAGLPCVFTDGHAIMRLSQFYAEQSDLGRVDWDVMPLRYWKGTADDPDRERRRQAEFLVHRQFPWRLVSEVVVRTSAARAGLIETLGTADFTTPVAVRRDYFI